ncbi:MAG TPA: DUF4132 domain-containing protein [Bryobacteraceae bacterium]|nr:DUF4132 domain-containing protein [Bryobacteraceae bacterium]
MTPSHIEQFRALIEFRVEPPVGASPHMQAIIAALHSKPKLFKERAAIKALAEPLERLKSAPDQERVAFVFEALAQMASHNDIALSVALRGAAAEVLRKGVPLNGVEAVRLIEAVSIRQFRFSFPYKALLANLKDLAMTPALSGALLRLRATIGEHHGMDEIQERIDILVHGKQEKPAVAISDWSRRVFQEMDASPKQMAWRRLFLHARSLTQSTASSKWQKDAVECVEEIGRAEFLEAARRWLALGPMPGMQTTLQVPEEEADYQKGFVWTLGALGEASIGPALADFAIACFRKIPQIGAVSHRVGNACVNALAAMPGLEAVTQISRLSMRVKYDVARRLIEKALAETAERNHVGRDDLEAMSVPSYGLTAAGVRIEVLGSAEAKLSIEDGNAVLTWSRGGQPLKAAPAEAKANHADAVADLKKTQKELQAVLSTQRLRLERQLLSESWCRFDCWQGWYLNHPVTSVFARRLIWEVDDAGKKQTVIWREGGLVDWAGQAVTPKASALVRLWHPIRSTVQEVLSWRAWLEDGGVRQPFKQAHREVYILTDAERESGTFSNRFAGHIVRQHQLAALCRERGWQFRLMGDWDSHNNAQLEIPRYGLRAELDVEFNEEGEVSGHMIYLAIATNQVRFYSLEAKRKRFELRAPGRALRLSEVRPVVFSEVMRDIDLFVGVTSIGADPAWRDQHGDAHAEYWHRFADGDLSTAAENRKSILERLVPKLSIREQCRFTDRHLVVRGESHEYKIHLGSGNVLMEPGSRYLCIVRGGGDSAATVPLPFEGDSMLAIILSKAMLLAKDKAIKDETILRQIRATSSGE